ncbi:hypothetical protein CRG98_003132 [Punica granatum]|uniref:Uncharacterized protein n=1 Tax=Punica granatum TaxID=22663 RepID=A0A2I0L762_PUNGR|nr:hypothetical protein CRG98_003132 [Punica granatum]
MAYEEGDSDWMCETGLDITRELDRSNSYGGNQAVYPVPLDPGNLPALDLQVVKWQVATPSHVRPSRFPGKVDTPKSRCIRFAHACPDEMKFECAQGCLHEEKLNESNIAMCHACFLVPFTCQWIGPLGSPVRKGACKSSGVSRLKQDASETRPDVSLVTLTPGGIFRVPHWAPFDALVIR